MKPRLASPDAAVHGKAGTDPFRRRRDHDERPRAETVELPRSSRWCAPFCVFLLAAVALVFGQTLRHEFVNFDDDRFVYQNPPVTSGLTLPGIIWAAAIMVFNGGR